MPDADEVKEQAARYARVAADRFQVLAEEAKKWAVVFAREGRQRGAVLAALLAEYFQLAARATARGLHYSAQATAVGAKRGALIARQGSRSLRTMSETGEVPEALQPYVSRLQDLERKALSVEVLSIRSSEDVQSSLDSVSHFRKQLEFVAAETMPSPAVAATAFLAARLVGAVNGIGDAAIGELLYGQSLLSRLGLVAAVTPGWLALVLYRNVLLKDIQLPPGWSYGGSLAGTSDDEDVKLQTAALLARNARCLPPAFWLAVSVSGAVSLQVVRDSVSRIVRSVLRIRFPVLLVFAAAFAANRAGKERLLSGVTQAVQRLPPSVADPLRNSLDKLQVASRLVVAKCQEQLQSQKFEGEPQKDVATTDEKKEQVYDATEEFAGQIDDAVEHFTAHLNDTRVVMLKSKGDERWYQNSSEEPAEFKPMPEAVDAPLFRGQF